MLTSLVFLIFSDSNLVVEGLGTSEVTPAKGFLGSGLQDEMLWMYLFLLVHVPFSCGIFACT